MYNNIQYTCIINTVSFVQVSLLHSAGKHALILETVRQFFQLVGNEYPK